MIAFAIFWTAPFSDFRNQLGKMRFLNKLTRDQCWNRKGTENNVLRFWDLSKKAKKCVSCKWWQYRNKFGYDNGTLLKKLIHWSFISVTDIYERNSQFIFNASTQKMSERYVNVGSDETKLVSIAQFQYSELTGRWLYTASRGLNNHRKGASRLI